MEKEVKVKAVGLYAGHSVKVNKAVDLGLKFNYDELQNYIQTIQMLNENVTLYVKLGDKKAQKIGMFTIKEIKIDKDGKGVLRFNSQIDYVEVDALNNLVGEEQFTCMFKSTISVEEEGDE